MPTGRNSDPVSVRLDELPHPLIILVRIRFDVPRCFGLPYLRSPAFGSRGRKIEDSLPKLFLDATPPLSMPRVLDPNQSHKVQQVGPIFIVLDRTDRNDPVQRSANFGLESRKRFLQRIGWITVGFDSVEISLGCYVGRCSAERALIFTVDDE